MTLFEIRRRYDTLIYLVACALCGVVPKKELFDSEQVSDIYEFSKFHTVAALVASALESAGLAPGEAIVDKNMAIRKVMLLDAERARIFAEFEKAGIKYMPLKGVIMKDLYPSIGLRQMADNDILFDPQYRKKVRDIMVELGFTVQHYERSNHDVYLKPPVYNYEMHISLFEHSSRSVFADFFENALEDGVKDADNSYGYSMTDENFYLYFKAHEYKHHTNGGTGIRSLVDNYVFLKAKGDKMDKKLLEDGLRTLELLEYEGDTVSLANKIFELDFCEKNLLAYQADEYVDPLSDWERRFLDGYFFSGTYGTKFTSLKNSIKRYEKDGKAGRAKIKYICGRIFRDMEYYKTNYPLAYRYKVLIPFVVIGRVLAMIFLRPKTSFSHLKLISKYKSDKK